MNRHVRRADLVIKTPQQRAAEHEAKMAALAVTIERVFPGHFGVVLVLDPITSVVSHAGNVEAQYLPAFLRQYAAEVEGRLFAIAKAAALEKVTHDAPGAVQ